MWKAGTIIVCIDDTGLSDSKQIGLDNGIRKSQMYTVRSYAEAVRFIVSNKEVALPGVWLNEVCRQSINNTPQALIWYAQRNKDPCDLCYGAFRFRLLESAHDEREVTLSIKSFI